MRDNGAMLDCLELMDSLIARMDRYERKRGARADDANWDEGKHPRDPDGKFSSTGGGTKKSESMKPDPSKYNSVRAAYIKKKLDEIAAAFKSANPKEALSKIEVKAGHGKTKAYIDQLIKEQDQPTPEAAPSNKIMDQFDEAKMKSMYDETKKTLSPSSTSDVQTALDLMDDHTDDELKKLGWHPTALQEIVDEAQGLNKAKASEKAKPLFPDAVEATKKISPDMAKLMLGKYTPEEITSFGYDPATMTDVAKKVEKPKPLETTAETKAYAEKMKTFLPYLLPDNKKKFEAQLNKIQEALESGDKAKVKAIEPVPNTPAAKSITAVNDYLQMAKKDLGVSTTTTAGISSFAESEAHKANVAATKAMIKSKGHFEIFQKAKGVTADGQKVTAVLDVSSENVPYDGYVQVSAALKTAKGAASHITVTQAMQAYHDKVWPDTPSKEAIKSYQGSGYSSINSALAKGQVSEKAAAIDKAMAKSFVPADLPVFRGIRGTLEGVTGFSNPEEAVGSCFVHTAFASVSRSESTSSGFAGSYSDSVMMKFTVPAGARGIVMPKQNYEEEILLDRNGTFRIDKAEVVGKRTVLHCTYLGRKED